MNGEILQTKVTVATNEKMCGAVKKLNLEIQIPSLDENNIDRISIIEVNSKGTDGKEIIEAKLPNEYYSFVNGILTINKDSQKWLIEDQELEDKNDIKDLIDTGQKEMYYSSPGEQTYLINYLIKNTSLENQILDAKIKATITTFGSQDIKNVKVQEFEYNLNEKIGDVVSYDIQNETQEISKGYMYYNYNKDNQNLYDVNYNEKRVLNISNNMLVDEIYIEDISNYYIDKNGTEYELNDIYYNQISIPKEIFDTILGEDGEIQIQRSDGSLVASLNRELDENENYIYKFDSNESQIKLKISKPITEGNLILNINKVQTNSEYDKNTYKEFEYIVSKSRFQTNTENQEFETKVHLIETTLQPSLEISLNRISTFAQSLVEVRVKLNNDNINSAIYGNAKFNIEFPKYVKQIDIENYNIVYGEELELDSVEVQKSDNDTLVLETLTKGRQENLSSGIFAGGTNIIIYLKVDSSNNLHNLMKDVVFTFENTEPEIIITDSGGLNENIVQEKVDTNNLKDNKSLKGNVWIDENSNGMKDEEESIKENSKVFLISQNSRKVVDTTLTNSEGDYEFENIDDGKYVVLFEYNSDNYILSNYKSNKDMPDSNSDVISANIKYNGKEIEGAVTEVITIGKEELPELNMGLIQKDIFDLELKNQIHKIIIHNSSGDKIKTFNNVNLAKAELSKKNMSSSKIDIEYLITVENKGNVDGYAKNIVDYIPDGLKFDNNKNPNWYRENDRLYTRALSTKKITKGEKEQVNLILTLEMTDGNTKLVNNTAEIAEDYNEYGLEDINSNPLNRIDSENDSDSADLIISVKLGGKFIYTSVLLTTIMLGGIIVFILINKIRMNNRKEGGVYYE